jgi:hypothetical protein
MRLGNARNLFQKRYDLIDISARYAQSDYLFLLLAHVRVTRPQVIERIGNIIESTI